MRSLVRILSITGLVSACLCSPALAATAQRTFTYRCEDGTALTATFVNLIRAQAVRLSINGKTLVLPQRRSGSGARFAGQGTIFWIKGRGAMLMRAGKTTNCETD